MLQQAQTPQVAQAFLTAGLTIFGGLFILVAGQIIVKFIIEPIQEQAKTIGKIASDPTLYGNVYTKIPRRNTGLFTTNRFIKHTLSQTRQYKNRNRQ